MRHRALSLIRPDPLYRSDAFAAGVRACGFDLVTSLRDPRPDDILLIWNRYGHGEDMAQRFEKVGAATIVCENGLIGKSENAYAKQYTSDTRDPSTQLYTMSLGYHNGAGRWWIGEPGRWRQQGIEIKPWRKDGEHILVLPQRGFGPEKVAPPKGWTERIIAWLKTITYRPVRLRPHPGNYPAKTPLADDLRDCWCCVTWGSGAGIKSICAGIPCYSPWGRWVGFPGALPLDEIGFDDSPHWWQGLPFRADIAREKMLDRLAWLQWTVAEIATGEPFKRLLRLYANERANAA